MARAKGEKSVKLSITMHPDVLSRVDAYASKMGIGRSAALAVLSTQALDGQDGIRAIGEMVEVFQQSQMEEVNKNETA